MNFIKNIPKLSAVRKALELLNFKRSGVLRPQAQN